MEVAPWHDVRNGATTVKVDADLTPSANTPTAKGSAGLPANVIFIARGGRERPGTLLHKGVQEASEPNWWETYRDSSL